MLESGLGSVSAGKLVSIIYREHGLKGLYRGFTATALRDAGYGAYFLGVSTLTAYMPWLTSAGKYEAASRCLTSPSFWNGSSSLLDSPSLWVLFISGGVAGVVGWLSTFPLDVVKTRMQSTEARSATRLQINPYRTTISTIRHSYHTSGFNVFFRGLSPTLMRWVGNATMSSYNTARINSYSVLAELFQSTWLHLRYTKLLRA